MQTELAAPDVPESDVEIKVDARQVNFFYGDSRLGAKKEDSK